MTKDFPYPVVMRLSPVPWAGDRALARVMAALGTELGVSTLIVGGAVRAAVRGQKAADIDLATTLTPDQVMARAVQADLRAVPTGLDHGTVTIVADGRGFEVTTLRKDIKTDGRHAQVEFTDDWGADAARRDFTLNALYANFAGDVFDPCGQGLADAREGRIRFVGDPTARIAEDYLRILRFFRFYAHYGRGEMDPVGLAACAAARAGLQSLSAERVTQEVIKLLSAEDPRAAIKKINENNILDFVFDPTAAVPLDRLVAAEIKVGGVDALLRLLVAAGGDIQKIESCLRLSNKEIKYLNDVSNVKLEAKSDLFALRRDAARYGIPAVLAAVKRNVAMKNIDLPNGCEQIRGWTVPVCPVGGDDFLAVGLSGPAVGLALAAAREKWVMSDFAADKEVLLAAARGENKP